MPRVAKEMSALEVKRLSQPGMYAVGGVPGLHLQVLPGGGKTWLLRVTVGATAEGKQRRSEVGLGGYPAVTLQQARDKAREVREKIAQGIDPVAERKAARSALMASRATEITFEEAAQQYIAAKSPEWKNAKHAQQWNNTLTGDLVLGAAIVTVIDRRPRDRRPFAVQAFAERALGEVWKRIHAKLEGVQLAYKSAVAADREFVRGKADGITNLSLALSRQAISDAEGDEA